MEKWINRARELGFDEVYPLKVETLIPLEAVRDMCAADKCRSFGKNWTCPPHCGTLAQCGEKMSRYAEGLLLQTVGHQKKRIDTRCYRETEARHLESFRLLSEAVREVWPEALCLGSGGCRICRHCAYPDPCHFPDRAQSSMEAYGLLVSRVCAANGAPYSYGEGTIAYCACILLPGKE